MKCIKCVFTAKNFYSHCVQYQISVERWRRCCDTNRKALVRFQTVSLEIFIDIILPIALCPWSWLSH